MLYLLGEQKEQQHDSTEDTFQQIGEIENNNGSKSVDENRCYY